MRLNLSPKASKQMQRGGCDIEKKAAAEKLALEEDASEKIRVEHKAQQIAIRKKIRGEFKEALESDNTLNGALANFHAADSQVREHGQKGEKVKARRLIARVAASAQVVTNVRKLREAEAALSASEAAELKAISDLALSETSLSNATHDRDVWLEAVQAGMVSSDEAWDKINTAKRKKHRNRAVRKDAKQVLGL